jgi:hypothetical protein
VDLAADEEQQAPLTKISCRSYCVSGFPERKKEMVAYFQLQPAETELQELADEYWKKSGEKERELEKAAFESGEAIRNGELTLGNLEAVVRWKSERAVHYLIANSNEKIRNSLKVAANPESSTEAAVKALLELQGVDIPVASAILAAIFPERYTVLDFRTLEALGHARHDVHFYQEYLEYCKRLAESNIVKAQDGVPAATPLRTLERALGEWSRRYIG